MEISRRKTSGIGKIEWKSLKKLDNFVKDVKKENGKLSYLDLKKLNSVYKREYTKIILDENDGVNVLI